MLTEQEINEIKQEMRKYLLKRAVGPEALKIVQKYRGWVSSENLRDVARLLETTDDELDSVGTCYNLVFRRPVGRHCILVCDSVSCWVMGGQGIRDYICRRLSIGLGQTTTDGRFTLLPVACLGACDKAPAMMVDDQLYGHLNPDKIESILEQYE